MKKSRNPKKIRVTSGKDAWIYVNDRSIDICIQGFGTVLSARITQSQLEKLMP